MHCQLAIKGLLSVFKSWEANNMLRKLLFVRDESLGKNTSDILHLFKDRFENESL